MLNKLKAKTIIHCNICGCKLNKVKTIKVSADNKEDAIKEADLKIKKWKESLQGVNCKTCQSIINDLK